MLPVAVVVLPLEQSLHGMVNSVVPGDRIKEGTEYSGGPMAGMKGRVAAPFPWKPGLWTRCRRFLLSDAFRTGTHLSCAA